MILKKSHYKDKMVLKPSYLSNVIFTWLERQLQFWIRPLDISLHQMTLCIVKYDSKLSMVCQLFYFVHKTMDTCSAGLGHRQTGFMNTVLDDPVPPWLFRQCFCVYLSDTKVQYIFIRVCTTSNKWWLKWWITHPRLAACKRLRRPPRLHAAYLMKHWCTFHVTPNQGNHDKCCQGSWYGRSHNERGETKTKRFNTAQSWSCILSEYR